MKHPTANKPANRSGYAVFPEARPALDLMRFAANATVVMACLGVSLLVGQIMY